MRLLSIVRFCTWSAITGSVAAFVLSSPENAEHRVDQLSRAWHLASALLVGGGALGARKVLAVDRRLNHTWHWVSYVRDPQGSLIRVAMGQATIEKIHKWKRRESAPADVIYGQASDIDGEKAGPNAFGATAIHIGRGGNVFYEWAYSNGIKASGWTRIWCQTTGPARLLKPRKYRVTGQFVMDSSFGSGSIDFYESPAEADHDYRMGLARLNNPARPQAA